MLPTLSMIVMMKIMKKINPLNLAIMIMILSIITSNMMFKISLSSWISLILIITFSTGMMLMFTYISSISPNEKAKKKMKWSILILLVLSMKMTKPESKMNKSSMKVFSNQFMMVLMTIILIIAILAISLQTYNPNQSMISTF